MKKEITSEIKVGALAIAALMILIIIFFRMGNFDFTKKGYNIKVLFNFASGIMKNAPVRLLGVEVGRVEGIDIQYNDETKIILTLRLGESTKLRMDAKAYVSALGLMGEKYIELKPGSNKAPLLQPGSTIVGEDPFQMESFTRKSEEIMEKLSKALTDVRSLTTNMDGMVTENRDQVQKILENVEETTASLKALSGDLKNNPWKIMTKPRDWKKKME